MISEMTSEPVSISVVIPTYNRKESVCGAIDSVLAQTYLPAEIVVVNDGSTDGTVEYLKDRYGDKINLVSQANQGASAARNFGVSVATSKWVAFLDSDDLWHPEKLKHQAELLKLRPDLDYVTCNGALVDTPDKRLVKTSYLSHATPISGDFYEVPDSLFSINWVYRDSRSVTFFLQALMIRRDIYEREGGLDVTLRVAEDYDFFVRIAKYSHGYVDRIGWYYRTVRDEVALTSKTDWQQIWEDRMHTGTALERYVALNRDSISRKALAESRKFLIQCDYQGTHLSLAKDDVQEARRYAVRLLKRGLHSKTVHSLMIAALPGMTLRLIKLKARIRRSLKPASVASN
ncbi:glycosyltransferase family 2 protein [Blastopirellula marina]|uniref:Glycosyltransferase 2-like domain-containing protein n=1 Tax=Blastopirellula marina TaxID=124 RepID=A0A2S8GHK1_9BACT|nr:glycosyltransferase [Blastopirellula marina]PQO43897.1 hypothetical protein C5Y93_22185 [Blastopirellula marina]